MKTDDNRLLEQTSVIDMADQFARARDNAHRSWLGHPIGYGRLAETAAEPVEFARLIHHLERASLVTDWPDTVPTNWSDLEPRQPEDDGIGAFCGAVWAIGITCAASAVGLLLAWII